MARLGTAKVAVSVNNHQWRQVSSFRDAGPNDTVFVLDPQNGSLRFGNGVQGATPPVGSTVSVSYRFGGGSSGNISKKIYTAIDVTRFVAVMRPRAQIIGWGNMRNIRRVKRRR